MRANTSLIMLFVAAISCTSSAEEPVYFADPNLKAAVEGALGVADPTPTDMLALRNVFAHITEISNLTGLEFAVNLYSLRISRSQISDISPLSGLTTLRWLWLQHNQISDISPLSNLMGLQVLDLSGNQISDISTLSGLTSLERLELGTNVIDDISPLSELKNLQVLDLYNNRRISDVSPLSGLTSLHELILIGNQISDILPLSVLTSLTELNLHNNQVIDISPLSELTSLEQLVLSSNQIRDISPLSRLSDLQKLNLSYNQISDISLLSGFTGLLSLRLSGNRISDISSLSGLTRLEDLWLSSTQVSDISSLSGLTNLEELRLSNNQISDILPLSSLTRLQLLILSWNQIRDIPLLSGLTSLRFLYLNRNQISDLSPLSGYMSLEALDLSYNQIRDLSPIAGLTYLQRVWLTSNQVSDISPLSGFVNMETLYLSANPLGIGAYTIHIPLFESYGTNVEYDPLVWRTLTTSSTTGGFVAEPGEGSFDFTNRTVVNTNAVAAIGYSFAYWTGTAIYAGKVADPAAAGTTVTMTEDYTLKANFEPRRFTLYVDDAAANDPGANDPQVSDPDEDGSPEHPYDTIREAIDVAEHGEVVLVYPGIYREEIDFLGKAITVQGAATSAGIPVLENPGGFSASFSYGEGPDSILKNFVIRNSAVAIFIAGSSPTISNITFVHNEYGIGAYNEAEPDISNCIFRGNTHGNLYQCRARYSCIEAAGQGNINADPLLVDPNSGDYHLRSEQGWHWPQYDIWVPDEVTSPCIDGGDPTVDPSDEPMPNGGIINMGAYGGTAYASKSNSPVTDVALSIEMESTVTATAQDSQLLDQSRGQVPQQ